MKGLNSFTSFDHEGFLRDKKLAVVGVKPWLDFDTKQLLGTAVETVIVSDKTPYRTRDGEKITNRFEKLVIKVRKSNLSVELEALVKPAGEVQATIYGDFRNQLSIKCSELAVEKQGV